MIRAVIWILVLVAAATPLAYFYMQEEVVEVTAAPVQRGMVEDTIAAISSGTVMPEQRAMIAAGTLGTIAQVHVAEGDRVVAGDLLVTLHHEELEAQVALAKANLAAGKARMNQAQLGVEIQESLSGSQQSQAAAQLAQAERDFQRLEALAAENAVAQKDLDQARLALSVAREAKIAADTGMREREVRVEEVGAAEAVIKQLEAAVAGAEAARAKAFVRAPFPGVVAEIMLKAGEAVAMGLPLLHLVQDDALYVEAPFDEINAPQLALGQVARVEVDAFDDTAFQGAVDYIAPVISPQMDLSRTLKVRVRLKEGEAKLLPGMSADVTVVAQKIEGAIYVPSESLIRNETAYVIVDDRAVERDVETGIGNWAYSQILSGLDEGETLITSIAVRGLDKGVKVRVVDELSL